MERLETLFPAMKRTLIQNRSFRLQVRFCKKHRTKHQNIYHATLWDFFFTDVWGGDLFVYPWYLQLFALLITIVTVTIPNLVYWHIKLPWQDGNSYWISKDTMDIEYLFCSFLSDKFLSIPDGLSKWYHSLTWKKPFIYTKIKGLIH